MERKLKVAYIPVTKVNWTNPELEKAREESRKFLESLPGVTVVGGEKMIEDEATAMAELERCRAEQVDLVVAHLLSFSLGVVLARFARTLRTPVVLWSIPEPPPNGGRLRANSFCAANMNSHILHKLYTPYFNVHGEITDPCTARQLERAVKVTRTLSMLREFRIGSIGGRVPGFFTSDCDEMLLRNKIGPEVVPLTMLEAVTLAKNQPREKLAEIQKILLGDAPLHASDGPTDAQFGKSAALFGAVQEMMDKYMLGAVTIRCWPEVIADELYGITICSTVGHLCNHGIMAVCEGDVYAAVMLSAMRELTGQLPFFCDLIKLDGDYGVAWHCGAAPCSLCKAGFTPEIRRSSTVGGGGVKGCVCEFPLKPGHVTFARLGETRDGSSFRLLIATGEGLDTELFVRGNPLKVRFDAGCDALRDEILNNGWEHHYAMAYGDLTEELLALGRAWNIETTIIR
ncbi:MAG: hypothetical protein IJJ33_21010 [Victivallales bacterium]|nr:hypothetical protein [Victivallales bacterium]